MKTFVINRRQDVERRMAISSQLEASGISYEMVEAVDGRSLSREAKAQLADFAKMRRVLRVLSDGEIGCAATHLIVYRRMLDEKLDVACVLEDDAKILCGGDLSWMSVRWADDEPHVRLLTDRRHGMVWTVGYLINRAAAKVMLRYNTPIWRVADCWESLVRRGRLVLDWCERTIVEPDGALGSVITPGGVPPHRQRLPRDFVHLLVRTCWRMAYGIGFKV